MIMEAKDKALIGIDPDVEKSGFALYDPKAKQLLTLQCYDLVDLMQELSIHNELYDLTVNLEAGWLAKGMNWRGGKSSANAVGRNHEIGRQLEKFFRKQGIIYKLILPQGYSGWTHDRFCKTTGWPVKQKTNPETRVAGMMVYGY